VKNYLRKSLMEDRFISAHGFRGFCPWLTDSIVFRPMARQKHYGGRAWQRKSYSLLGGHEVERTHKAFFHFVF
jgi:hypothetical protein